MKKYFKDPSVFDEDDMPCRCDCGNWFDLNDGWPSLDPYKTNVIVCEECHKIEIYEERQRAADEELNEIDDHEEYWDEDEETRKWSAIADESYGAMFDDEDMNLEDQINDEEND